MVISNLEPSLMVKQKMSSSNSSETSLMVERKMPPKNFSETTQALVFEAEYDNTLNPPLFARRGNARGRGQRQHHVGAIGPTLCSKPSRSESRHGPF
jgi:hypothetical protein